MTDIIYFTAPLGFFLIGGFLPPPLRHPPSIAMETIITGLTANPANGDPHYSGTPAMLIGRFLMLIPIMALAGSLVKKKMPLWHPSLSHLNGGMIRDW